MPRSNVVITCQPSPPMKLPYQIIHQQYQSPFHQHTSSSSPSPSPSASLLASASASASASVSASLSHSTTSDLHSSPDNFIQHSYVPSPTVGSQQHQQQHQHQQQQQQHQHQQQQIHPFVKGEKLPLSQPIPNSVKGAPAHLRPVIRKRQNSESAKRSRQRRKEAAKKFYRRFDEQCQRLSALEKKVASLIQLVKESDEDTPIETRTKQEHDVIPEHLPEAEVPQPDSPQTDSDESHRQHSAIVQSMAAMRTIYEEEQHPDHSGSSPQVPFQDDLDALLESCIHSQHMFGSC